MKARIFSTAILIAMTFAISCNDDTVSPQGPAGPALQENAVLVHAVMAEGMTKVTLGDDSGASTQVHWDAEDQIGIRIDETTYTFDRTDDAVGSKTADFEYKVGGLALPTLTAGEYTFTYPATGKATLASQTGTKEGLKNYHYMEATFTAEEEQDWNNLPGLSFETKVAIVKLTLKNEAFKSKEVSTVTLKSAEATYTATSVFTGTDADGSIVVYLAVEPADLTDCIITAVCQTKAYEVALSNNALEAGKLYKVGKTMEKAHTDLSPLVDGVYQTANCYIVSEAGDYKFKAVKGNGTVAVGAESTVDPVGTPTAAVVLWETFGTSSAPQKGDLVKSDVRYRGGYVYFSTADTYKEGNAVIAVIDDRDTDGTEDDVILWSWHIWLTDQPAEHVYNNSAGTMMDRNLGATSAAKGDVGALGLLYQWGRKDPFPGSSSISSNTVALSTLTWPSAVLSDASNGTIAYAVSNPTTFIKYNSSNNDWHYTGDESRLYTRWTGSGKAKSIYDPCPAGWRVPDGGANGVWSKALYNNSSEFDVTADKTNMGINFGGPGTNRFGSASTIWYPAAGQRSTSGALQLVATYGRYWAADQGSEGAGLLSLNLNTGTVNPVATINNIAGGNSVRCCKD